jgi:hypothetical protein
MACKKACRRTLEEKIQTADATSSVIPIQILERSFECVEKSHARDRSLRLDSSRLAGHRLCPMLMGYADISMAHFDGAREDLTSACTEGPSVVFDHLRWEAPQRATLRGGLGMSPIDAAPIERSVR